jgi:hypothetical protein
LRLAYARATELGGAQIQTAEVCASKIGVTEVHPGRVESAEVAPSEVGPDETRRLLACFDSRVEFNDAVFSEEREQLMVQELGGRHGSSRSGSELLFSGLHLFCHTTPSNQ